MLKHFVPRPGRSSGHRQHRRERGRPALTAREARVMAKCDAAQAERRRRFVGARHPVRFHRRGRGTSRLNL